MPGPAPEPTALKVLKGNPGHRPLNKREADPGGKPTEPDWISKRAKAAWRQLVPKLVKAGLATSVERNLLARYCTALVEWRDAEAFLDANGTTYTVMTNPVVVDGKVVQPAQVKSVREYPQARQARDLSALLLRMERELGMTPSARSRIELPHGGQVSTPRVEPGNKPGVLASLGVKAG